MERQVLARMRCKCQLRAAAYGQHRRRNRTFYGRGEAMAALRELTAALNRRPRTDWPGKVSRRDLLEQMERPCLRPLPERPYEYAEYKKARVVPDYRVAHQYQHYSVPWKLAGNMVEMRISEDLVEILQRGGRVAVHPRRHGLPGYSTLAEHMPENHRQFLEGTLEGLLARGKAIGPAVVGHLEGIVAGRDFPEQAYGACQGVLSLARRHSTARMEAACERLARRECYGYRVLREELSKEPAPAMAPMPAHAQVRGSQYYA